MDRRPRAFALILVLVATAVVFAIAIQGAVYARASSAEAAALLRRADAEREARSAVSAVLAGLLAGEAERAFGPDADDPPARPGAGGGGGADDFDDDGAPEMPPAMRELIGKLTGEDPPDSDGETPRAGATSRSAGSRGRDRPTVHDALVRTGMPTLPIEYRDGERRLLITFRDGGGLLNLNSASEEELARLFALRGVESPRDSRIAQELADYRDEDDFVRERGAERDAYLRLGRRPRNAPLEAVEELLFLPSMTRADFDRVRGDVCIEGDGRIHAATAPREVLASVDDLTPAGLQRLLARRAEGPMTREDLERALSPASGPALDRLRIDPSPRLLALVRPADGRGAGVEVELWLGSQRGVEFLATRPAPEPGAP
ncbi:MAG: general secretion pathway protein GspK [Phycisphaerales bacterium]